ncbi:MAG TPA: hypothetical protein VM901_00050 [Bdellovibrionota bacterium]|jgi:hypothetical protein|nr:hypothetical protein [Bdellovibrionota bacterium]
MNKFFGLVFFASVFLAKGASAAITFDCGGRDPNGNKVTVAGGFEETSVVLRKLDWEKVASSQTDQFDEGTQVFLSNSKLLVVAALIDSEETRLTRFELEALGASAETGIIYGGVIRAFDEDNTQVNVSAVTCSAGFNP